MNRYAALADGKSMNIRVNVSVVILLTCLFGLTPSLHAQLRALKYSGPKLGCATFSPDGRFLAVAIGKEENEESDGKHVVVITEAASSGGTKERPERKASRVHLPPGNGIAIWSVIDGEFKQWLKWPTNRENNPTKIKYSASGKYIAALGAKNNRGLGLWNASTGEFLRTIVADENGYAFGTDFVFNIDESRVMILDQDRKAVNAYSVNKGTIVQEFRGNDRDSESLVLSPDGKRIAVGFYIWDVASEKILAKSTEYPNMDSVVFTPNGDGMYGCGYDRVSIFKWDLRTNKRTNPFDEAIRAANVQSLYRLEISPAVDILATHPVNTAEHSAVRLWNCKSGLLAGHLEALGQSVEFLGFSPDGKSLVSAPGTFMTDIHIWDIDRLIKRKPNDPALGYVRYFLGESMEEEVLSNPSAVKPTGKSVDENTPLEVGSKILVRDEQGHWFDGVILTKTDSGKVTVHRRGWSHLNNMTVTISRLQLP